MKRFVCTVGIVIASMAGSAAEAVDFAKEVRPILAERCYECHGPEKQKGDLRLDQKEAMVNTEFLIEPGKPVDSDLYFRVSLPADDPDIMPPKGDPLSKEQQELIKKWIGEGAKFGDWVADKPAGDDKKIVLPEVNPADAKAVAALQELGALAMPLAQNTNLLNVDFRGVADQIGDSHLEKLQPIAEQIAWLNLGHTKISDAGLTKLKGMKHLMRLHLEQTAITDAGLAHLKPLRSLEYLNVYGTKVGNAGLNHLKELKNLQKVFAWQTNVTEAGAKELAKALPKADVNLGWKEPPKPKPEAKKDEKGKDMKKPEPKADKPKPEKKAEDKKPEKKDGKKDEKKPAPVAAKPINDNCPVSNKGVDSSKTVTYKDKVVAFCCDNCKGKFEKEPEKFAANLPTK